jgi:hypothetical protein
MKRFANLHEDILAENEFRLLVQSLVKCAEVNNKQIPTSHSCKCTL